MNKMELSPEENDAIDRLLRRSMAAPIPSLSPKFEQRVVRALRSKSEPLDEYHRNLLTGYSVVSVLVSALVMRGQGLPWGAVAASVMAPLIVVAVSRSVRSANSAASHRVR